MLNNLVLAYAEMSNAVNFVTRTKILLTGDNGTKERFFKSKSDSKRHCVAGVGRRN